MLGVDISEPLIGRARASTAGYAAADRQPPAGDSPRAGSRSNASCYCRSCWANLPRQDDWIQEVKFDGYRSQIIMDDDVRIFHSQRPQPGRSSACDLSSVCGENVAWM